MTNYLFQRVLTFFDQGGFVMPPLVLGAMLLWYALGYRMITLRRGRRASARQLLYHYTQKEPLQIQPKGLIDAAVKQGVLLTKLGVDDLRRYLDVAFFKYEKEMSRFRTLVNGIVVAAPLTGLLGTVSGMVETFDSLAEMALFTQTGGIAGGISEALFSTQMGLAVSIPGMIVGRILIRREYKLKKELAQIKNMLCMEENRLREVNA